MKKLITCLVLILIIVSIYNIAFSAGLDPIAAMDKLKGEELDADAAVTGKLGKVINTAIAIIQVAGTGISIIMVTMLGIKYITAAPSDKADVKKQIAPMAIGAVILFASVNLVGIISKIADTTLSQAVG